MKMKNYDLAIGLKKRHIWFNIAKTEIKFKFKRTKLGPLWITIGTAIFIAVLSVITGAFFADDINLRVPYITTGLIIWSFVFNCLNESAGVFSGRVGLIQNIPMEKSILIYIMICKAIFIFLFNFILYILCVIFLEIEINYNSFFALPGFFLLILNVFFISCIISILTTRFRDLAPITTSIMTVLFFLTPIWWNVEYFPSRAKFVNYNLFYHYLETTRKPLLGLECNLNSWIICIMSVLILGFVAITLFENKKDKIPFWA